VSAVKRAAELRKSQFAIGSTNNKRKRIDNSDDDDDDDEEDNSADAQLARALQKQEDEAQKEMVVSSSGRRPRKAQKLLPKSSYVMSDSDDDLNFDSAPAQPKLLTVELGARGSNGVAFPSKVHSRTISESRKEF